MLLALIFLMPLPGVRSPGESPWISTLGAALLFALLLGGAIGDRERLVRAMRPGRWVPILSSCLLVGLVANSLVEQQGLVAAYRTGPGAPVERTVRWRKLKGTSTIDRRIEFDDEAHGFGVRRFPLEPWNAWRTGMIGLRRAGGAAPADALERPVIGLLALRRPAFVGAWRGFLVAPVAGPHRLELRGTGRVSLRVGDESDSGEGSVHVDVRLDAGRPAPVSAGFEHAAGAPMRLALSWSGPSGSGVVPAGALFAERLSVKQLLWNRIGRVLASALLVFRIALGVAIAWVLLSSRELSRERRALIVVIGLAFAVRLAVHLLYFSIPLSSRSMTMADDDRSYLFLATELIHHSWLSPEQRAFYLAPLYRYFLALTQLAFGEQLAAIYLVQRMLGALTCGLVYLVGRRSFDHRVGLTAGLLAALWPHMARWESTTFITAFAAFLQLLSLLTVLLAMERGRRLYYALSGIVMGASILARPNWGFFLVFVVVGMLFARPRRAGLVQVALLLLFVCLTIAPVTMKNVHAASEFVPIATNGPVNLWIGNGADSTGGFRNPSEVHDDYLADTGAYVRKHPRAAAAHLLRKSWMVVRTRWLWILGGLALIGALHRGPPEGAEPRRFLRTAILVAPLTCIVFFHRDRFLGPAVPMLCVFAAVPLEAIGGLVARRLQPPRGWLVTVTCVLLAVPSVLVALHGAALENKLEVPWGAVATNPWSALLPWFF